MAESCLFQKGKDHLVGRQHCLYDPNDFGLRCYLLVVSFKNLVCDQLKFDRLPVDIDTRVQTIG